MSSGCGTSPTRSSPSPTPGDPLRSAVAEVRWRIVLGLASMALLWPLTDLAGVGDGLPRALVLLALTAMTWVGVVGLWDVAHPVLTLAVTGIGYGLVAQATALLLGGAWAWWTLVPGLVNSGLWGALLGLLAAMVQKARSDRRP